MQVFQQPSEQFDFIFKEKISDHKPMVMEPLLVWNILCLAHPGNNGFQMDERLDKGTAYLSRLEKIAQLINQWLKDNPNIQIVCLEEVPLSLPCLEVFLQALDWQYLNEQSIHFSKTGTHKFQNIILHTSRYLSKNITAQLPVSHSCQEGRYHVLEIEDTFTQQVSRLAHVHLQWPSMKKPSFKLATETILKELIIQHGCSLVGDFNQPLDWLLQESRVCELVSTFFYPAANSISLLKWVLREGEISESIRFYGPEAEKTSFSIDKEKGIFYSQVDGIILHQDHF
jgi:hypothetical protein